MKARELLTRFKLDAKEKDFAASLSGGQRKLLEMARALMSDPNLVMLDEPTAALDLKHHEDVMRVIRRRAEAGVAVAVVDATAPSLVAHGHFHRRYASRLGDARRYRHKHTPAIVPGIAQ